MEIIAMLFLMFHWWMRVERQKYSITTEGLSKYKKEEEENE